MVSINQSLLIEILEENKLLKTKVAELEHALRQTNFSKPKTPKSPSLHSRKFSKLNGVVNKENWLVDVRTISSEFPTFRMQN